MAVDKGVRNLYAFHHCVTLFYDKPKGLMKVDRQPVDRSGASLDRSPATLEAAVIKLLVQAPSDTFFSPIGMDAGEMDKARIRLGLGKEAHQKAGQFTLYFSDK